MDFLWSMILNHKSRLQWSSSLFVQYLLRLLKGYIIPGHKIYTHSEQKHHGHQPRVQICIYSADLILCDAIAISRRENGPSCHATVMEVYIRFKNSNMTQMYVIYNVIHVYWNSALHWVHYKTPQIIALDFPWFKCPLQSS